MIDFTNMPTRKKTYAVANGGKIAILYEGEQYTLLLIRSGRHSKHAAASTTST